MRTLLIIGLFLMATFSCNSQSIKNKNSFPNYNHNKFDSLGQKTGLWLEDNGMQEVYFKSNKRNGIFKSYYPNNGKLHCLGEYKDDDPVGTWYYFNESSEIKCIEKTIEINTDLSFIDKSGERRTPDHKSYLIWYYPDGTIKEEGIVLYSESIEIDFVKYGKWKYYNKSGVLTKIEENRNK